MGLSTKIDQILVDGDLPDDVLLGRIVLFTITDQPVTRQQLEQWFIAENLNTALLPPEIKPVDAFKKATSEAKEKYSLPNGQEAVVLCRDVTSTPEFVRRQITREVKDSRARTLSYSKAIDCTFYRAKLVKLANGTSQTQRGSERVHIKVDPTGLGSAELQAVQDIATKIQARYTRYYNHLDGNRLRAVVRDYMKHLNAIELKGGVYFIHVAHSDELARLRTVVHKFGGGCQLHTVPLVDIERERKMVAAAFEREASENLQEIAAECRALRATRKNITPSAYGKIKQRYDEVVKKAGEHMVTLQVSQDITGAAAEVALDALLELQEELLK